MSPAIERILADNEFSVRAAEQMLAVLARCPDDEPCGEAEVFRKGLDRLQQNVTEEAERPLIAAVERDGPPALGGDPNARVRVVAALGQLADINRDSMVVADAEAKRLGVAGGWAAVLLGFAAFGVAWVFGKRLQRRVVAPLRTLERVACAARNGDLKRRAQSAQAADDLRLVADGLNRLLDRLTTPSTRSAEPVTFELDRAVLLHLLDRQPVPVIVFDRGVDQVLAANRLATDLLVGMEDAKRTELLAEAADARVGDYVAKADAVPRADLVICELAPHSRPPANE